LYELFAGDAVTRLSLLTGRIQYAGQHGYSLVIQFFKVYGSAFICMLLTLVSVPVVLKKLSGDRRLAFLSSFYGPLAGLVLVVGLLFISNLTSPTRIVPYVVMISVVFTGFILYWIIQKTQGPHHRWYLSGFGALFVSIILISVFALGVARFYPSSYILVANEQVTRTEITGMEWFFNNKEISTPITSIYITPRRFADFLLDSEERRQHRPVLKREEISPPWHFGYTEHVTLGESYAEDNYLLLSDIDRVTYEEVFPGMAEIRFLPNDFEELENDPSIDKLYSNGGMDVWYIQAPVSAP
jgi:hypothetical protein